MKILISAGIYPPDIGGPSQYARNLYETWKKQGHEVKVAAYRWERALPPVVKHFLFFTKVLRKGWNADLILTLDNFLAAVPTMLACAILRKKYIIRTGGDLLWEWYVERTGEMILFKDFYSKKRNYSLKEKIILYLSTIAFRRAAFVVYSTEWQKGIFEKAYKLDPKKSKIIENFCGPRDEQIPPENRMFVAGVRELKWKNTDLLKSVFKKAQIEVKNRGFEDIEFDPTKAVYDNFQDRMRRSYAVILTSIGDISPNMIFDAIRVGTPFILTKETGIADRVRDCAIFVDPINENDIKEKIVWISDPKNRELQAEKVKNFKWVHTWEDICREFVTLYGKI
jgi:glycosyltransferase involved in cell wall biosynthesis